MTRNAVKDKTRTTLRMSLKMFAENDLPDELLVTTRQNAKWRNKFNNNMSTDLKSSKAQISKIIKSRGFLGRLLGPLLKTGLPLIKNVIKELAKSVLVPAGLAAAVLAVDAGIHKKIVTNKVLREKSHCVVCRSNKSRFLKQKIN